jgi:DNA-binding transcriptional LysR family regulator
MAVLCRRGHPLRGARTWGEVVDAEWLMHIAPGSQHANWLEYLKSHHQRIPERIIEVNSFGTSWSLVSNTDALLVAPAEMLRLPPYGEMVERVPLGIDLPTLPLGLLTLRGIPLSMAATKLAEQFRRFLALHRH